MTKNAFWKDSLRQVRATLNRFLAILVITALGVAFFAGLRASGPDMRATASAYYDELNFMDVRLLSTIGFDENDVDAVRNTQGVLGVMPAYSYDAIVELSSENLTIRLDSLSEEPNTENDINAPNVVEGRMPESSGECLVDPHFITLSGYQIGDTVNLVSGTATLISDTLKTDAFQIVGIAESPLYISNERGSSDIGSGKMDAYVMVPAGDFTLPVYTEIYVTIENEAGRSRFEDTFTDLLEPIETALKDVGELRASVRYAEIQDEATQELDDAKAELNDGWAEYNQSKADFDTQIADAQQQLDDGYVQYNQGLAEYAAGLSALEAAKTDTEAQFSQAEDQLAQGQTEYESGLGAYNDGKVVYDALVDALAAGNTPEAIATISGLISEMQDDGADLAMVLSAYVDNPDDATSIAAAQGAVAEFGNVLEQSKQQLDEVAGTLDEKSVELEQARLDAQSQLDESQDQLDESSSQLNDLKETLDKNREELEQSRIEGQDGLAEAKERLEEAAQEIADGEEQLAELEMPEWYILDHDTNIGFASYKEDAERIDTLSVVFPLLFFLVAILVSMTSMTRLVESDRPHIGTLKALGYSNGKIASRYLLYALAASSLGSGIGLIVGFNLFPRVIFNAYSVLYNLPPIMADFNLKFAVISTVAAVSCATLPAWFICVRALRGTSAEMMRPAAPNSGKRILLERITPLWKMLNFSQKVAMRNLFRYKKRFFMTIFGVAGCTALMFAGFGLRDGITTIEPKQYENIQRYDLQIDFEGDAPAEEKQSLDEEITSSAGILSETELFQESVDFLSDGQLKSTTLIVPEVISEFSDFIHLQNRETQETLVLSDDSVIITERLSVLFDLQVGDTFVLRDGDGQEATVQVGGIAEYYLYHYIYMSPSLYRSSFGKEPVANQMLCLLRDPADDNSALATSLLEQSCVTSVTLTANVRASFENIVNSLHYVVWVLIISAAMLVFVVLFSLTTINLEERGRELATIKVLGFYDWELAAYIYRENSLLTIIGTVLGLLLGIVLQRYIITTMETDVLMFSRDLLWQSYVYSAGLTIFFAAVVNLVMFRHISKIDMVSSLKSIE